MRCDERYYLITATAESTTVFVGVDCVVMFDFDFEILCLLHVD